MPGWGGEPTPVVRGGMGHGALASGVRDRHQELGRCKEDAHESEDPDEGGGRWAQRPRAALRHRQLGGGQE
jgi:hypothetical protein